jgi:hypothetical protein
MIAKWHTFITWMLKVMISVSRTLLEERMAACFTGVEVSSWLIWPFLTTPTLFFSEAERGPNPDT